MDSPGSAMFLQRREYFMLHKLKEDHNIVFYHRYVDYISMNKFMKSEIGLGGVEYTIYIQIVTRNPLVSLVNLKRLKLTCYT